LPARVSSTSLVAFDRKVRANSEGLKPEYDNFRQATRSQPKECPALFRSKNSSGKEAIRFNALTYGLRTRATILPDENAADYSQLWDELEADWQPQTRTERCYLETMVTSQWLLRRVAESEQKIYAYIDFGEHQFKMLAYVAKQRAQLERSFRTAIADMKQSQKERRQPQPAQTSPSPRSRASPQPQRAKLALRFRPPNM
jgi:hypothetical protein